MSNRNCVAFSLVSLALTCLVFASLTNAQLVVTPDKVSPFCVKSLDKPFCYEIVKVAKTWEEAITSVLSATITQTKMAEPIMASSLVKLPPTTDAKLKDKVDKECRESYNDAHETLKEVEDLLKTGDKTKSANIKISSAMSRLNDCQSVSKKIQMPTEFLTFFEGSKKLLSTCLAVERTRPDLLG